MATNFPDEEEDEEEEVVTTRRRRRYLSQRPVSFALLNAKPWKHFNWKLIIFFEKDIKRFISFLRCCSVNPIWTEDCNLEDFGGPLIQMVCHSLLSQLPLMARCPLALPPLAPPWT